MGKFFALATVLCLCASIATATTHELCYHAARTAARQTGVPLDVLMAISLTETGRSNGDHVQPWPWAMNAAGAGYWHTTRQDAVQMATRLREEGRRNFDLGCFQINYRWHGQAFSSLDAMLDPGENALYAAQFLSRLHAELGDWSIAAGRYHSATPELAELYRARFDRHFSSLSGISAPPPVPGPVRENRYPLLVTGRPGASPGSLMPFTDSDGPFLRAAAKPFWSGS